MLPERVTSDSYKKINPYSSYLLRVLHSTVDEHQQRYIFAAQKLKGAKSILDIASGCGWGSAYMADITGSNVIGIDNDEEAITEAQANFSRLNVRYLQGDILHLCKVVGRSSFAGIVNFETLEHFPQNLGPVILQNLKSALADGGKLYISSPNGPLFSPYADTEGKPRYRYHFKEYNPDELYQLLNSSGFDVKGVYGQRFVDPNLYLKLARIMRPIRDAALQKGLSWDHRQMRLPLTILFRLAALQDDARVKPLDQACNKQPLLLTAICEA